VFSQAEASMDDEGFHDLTSSIMAVKNERESNNLKHKRNINLFTEEKNIGNKLQQLE
jgi:hypothetical protein